MTSPSIDDSTSNKGQSFTLTNGKQVTLPPHDEFYARLVTRNRGVIPEDEQQRLRRSMILVAGCGSVGGAVIEPFVRLGAERLTLAEPDTFDWHNMNRQAVRIQDVDRNKAEVFQERMRDINPYADITVEPHGITEENVARLVRASAIIIDAVDVTTKAPLKAKYMLHEQAKRYRVPVLAGYDLAGLQLFYVYDYRKDSTEVLNGKVTADEIDEMEPLVYQRRVVPIAAMPYEIIPELFRQLRGQSSGFPQIVYTAHLFGVLALPAALDVLAGRPVKSRVILDIQSAIRPLPARAAVLAKRLWGLYNLNNEWRGSRKAAAKQSAAPAATRPA